MRYGLFSILVLFINLLTAQTAVNLSFIPAYQNLELVLNEALGEGKIEIETFKCYISKIEFYQEKEKVFSEAAFNNMNICVSPNPASDLIAIQVNSLVDKNFDVELLDISGKLVSKTQIKKGSTIAYFDVQTVYEGTYLVRISIEGQSTTPKVIIIKN